jgi:hypothetical protein
MGLKGIIMCHALVYAHLQIAPKIITSNIVHYRTERDYNASHISVRTFAHCI